MKKFATALCMIYILPFLNNIKCQDIDTLECILKETPFTYVEKMPAFQGGEKALNAFISSNLIYPKIAWENGIEGTVLVQFVIDKKGYVLCPKILRGIGGGCEEEVLRILSIFPNWSPGMHNGENVFVRFVLPVRFHLEDKRKKRLNWNFEKEIIKSLTNDCDKEVLRIIQIFPKWNPGIDNDKPVPVTFTLPIEFKL